MNTNVLWYVAQTCFALTCFQHWWGCQYTRWPPGGTHMDTHIHSVPFWKTKQVHTSVHECHHSVLWWHIMSSIYFAFWWSNNCVYTSTLHMWMCHYIINIIYNDCCSITLSDLNQEPERSSSSVCGWRRDLWQLRQSRSTVLQAQNARESHVSLTMPAKALVPGIRVKRYLEQWLPWTRLVRSP